MRNQFEIDIVKGLSSSPKRLFAKYFYDSRGDELFQQIMRLESYYPTTSELEIFHTNKLRIIDNININQSFQMIEFGAGDGMKTKVLLKSWVSKKKNFSYHPIDISSDVLEQLRKNLAEEVPGLLCYPLADTYFNALNKLKSNIPKLVLFLGGNLGNFSKEKALSFLNALNERLNPGDYFLLGVDLKKHPKIILDAYNDKEGVTKDFNLNLLHRINRELDGNFKINNFDHFPVYNPVNGECKSYLISLTNQEVTLSKPDRTFRFSANEPIFMEVSKKFSLKEIEGMANETGFNVVEHFTDSKGFFLDTLWRKK